MTDTVQCMIMRDYWDAKGERHRKGKIVELPAMEALDVIETGAMKRLKDVPHLPAEREDATEAAPAVRRGRPPKA